jgi:hypothetical protein
MMFYKDLFRGLLYLIVPSLLKACLLRLLKGSEMEQLYGHLNAFPAACLADHPNGLAQLAGPILKVL